LSRQSSVSSDQARLPQSRLLQSSLLQSSMIPLRMFPVVHDALRQVVGE